MRSTAAIPQRGCWDLDGSGAVVATFRVRTQACAGANWSRPSSGITACTIKRRAEAAVKKRCRPRTKSSGMTLRALASMPPPRR